LVFRVP